MYSVWLVVDGTVCDHCQTTITGRMWWVVNTEHTCTSIILVYSCTMNFPYSEIPSQWVDSQKRKLLLLLWPHCDGAQVRCNSDLHWRRIPANNYAYDWQWEEGVRKSKALTLLSVFRDTGGATEIPQFNAALDRKLLVSCKRFRVMEGFCTILLCCYEPPRVSMCECGRGITG